MKTKIQGHYTKALIDTASNHSMITRSFLARHDISWSHKHTVTLGISASEAACLGSVHLESRVGRHIINVKYTVVESLPTAATELEPNEVLFALDVISAVGMQLSFHKQHILITIPAPAVHTTKRRKGTPWFAAIHLHHNKHTTESSDLDDFVISRRELKNLTAKARMGKHPLFVAHVKPTAASLNVSCANTRKKGYLSEQVAPAHQPQAPDTIPPAIRLVIDKHTGDGGTLGPAPPNTSASGFEMNIDLLPGARPKAARQYRLTPLEQLELEKQLRHLIDMGWVKPSISPWASCVLFAPKP